MRALAERIHALSRMIYESDFALSINTENFTRE